jgi:hypothetical protein
VPSSYRGVVYSRFEMSISAYVSAWPRTGSAHVSKPVLLVQEPNSSLSYLLGYTQIPSSGDYGVENQQLMQYAWSHTHSPLSRHPTYDQSRGRYLVDSIGQITSHHRHPTPHEKNTFIRYIWLVGGLRVYSVDISRYL